MRVLLIGLDSLDVEIVRRFLSDLPNMRELLSNGYMFDYHSVYPPDSLTCWASIYTGLNPAKHGILYFRDPLDKVSNIMYTDIDNSPIRGRTFWDRAGEEGKKVCILFPHVGYPAWPVNGVMISRTDELDVDKHPISIHPPDFADPTELAHLNGVKGLPSGRNYGTYLNHWRELIECETQFAVEMMRKVRWDLFFVYSSGADWVQHNLWMFFDEHDPAYPGPNEFSDAIPQIYRWYDSMIGRLVEQSDDETVIMVLSDHGHGRRPSFLVNINEYLCGIGLLRRKYDGTSVLNPYFTLERIKRKATQIINKYSRSGLGNLSSKILKAFPVVKDLYTSSPSVDWKLTKAYASDLSGIKAYTYGGIIINRSALANGEYEPLRRRLIGEISQLRHPTSGERLLSWIGPREDYYDGQYLAKYPDIIFELITDFGVGWSLGESLVTPCYTHNIQPGSHKADSPLLIMSQLPKPPKATQVFSMDICPTVLSLLGCKNIPLGLDGSTFLT